MQFSYFDPLELDNRLGQKVLLGVTHIHTKSRDYVFVTALNQQLPNFVGKNVDHFAFQLIHHFQLDPNRLELVETRDMDHQQCFWRWRFDWVGRTPLSARSELVKSPGQRQVLLSLLSSSGDQLKTAAN